MPVKKLITASAASLPCFVLSLCLASKGPTPANRAQQTLEDQASQEHIAWVTQALDRMLTVKTGMTRRDLLEVFTTEGGLSTRLRRTYVYRECPLFKVDVEFTPVGRPARDSDGRVTLVESERDVIKSISRPYLGRPVVD